MQIYVENFKTNIILGTSGYPSPKVLLNCITELQDYFDIDKWQINQPIIISEIKNLIGGVLGVQMGALIVQRISGELLRMLLGIIIICLCLFLISELIIDPKFIFILDLL